MQWPGCTFTSCGQESTAHALPGAIRLTSAPLVLCEESHGEHTKTQSFLWGELVWFHWGWIFSRWARICWKSFWDFKINILGKKDETIIHFCDKCELPIRIYGRMLPCKHAFCYACAILLLKEGDKICPSCSNFVQQIELHSQGSIFVCNTVQGCKRSYLSQRDLQAHINFRHVRARNSVPHT